MLIENEQLNILNFKEFFPKLTWTRIPRKLGVNHRDFFYIGSYEDDKIIVKASIRPSLRMQVFETFKNRTVDGEIPPPGHKGKLCDWGGSVTVKVDENFFSKIKEVSVEMSLPKIQTLSW